MKAPLGNVGLTLYRSRDNVTVNFRDIFKSYVGTKMKNYDLSLSDLKKKIEKVQEHRRPKKERNGRGMMLGLAYRLSIELCVGICVGGIIGWLIDDFFSTSPLFLLVMLVLGLVAGIFNMMRETKRIGGFMQMKKSNVKVSIQDKAKR